MRKFRKLLIAATMIAGTVSTAPATAAIYKYNLDEIKYGYGKAVLTIDTNAKRGSIIGGGINATFEGKDLANFSGGFNLPDFGAEVTIDSTSTWDVSGGSFKPVAPGEGEMKQMLEMGNYPGMTGAGTNKINLWSKWSGTRKTCYLPGVCVTVDATEGDYISTAIGYAPGSDRPTTTTSGGTTTTTSGGTTTTTSGGTTTTTSGGTTTSTSGGTKVPEPGMLGLIGMSLLSLGYARRRRTNLAAKPGASAD